MSERKMINPYKTNAETSVADQTAFDGSSEFWQFLIDERKAAEFLGLSARHMQGLRSRGGGPIYVRISSRCVRYRRVELRQWAEERLAANTSEHSARLAIER